MNNFVRNGDVKETLQIGRKARALKLSYVDIKAEAAIHVVKGSLNPSLIAKYNLGGETAVLKMGFAYILKDHALITALTILREEGISRRFDDYLHEKIMMNMPSFVQKYPDISFDLSEEILTRIKWVLLKTEREDLPEHFFTFQLTFKSTGMDILYRNELYRIAPPKDGGLEEDE